MICMFDLNALPRHAAGHPLVDQSSRTGPVGYPLKKTRPWTFLKLVCYSIILLIYKNINVNSHLFL